MYFEVHQPFRLRRFSFFDRSDSHGYFDDQKNGDILRKVAQKSYLPTNELILRLIDEHQGRFRVSYSITGVALEQFKRYSPETLASFQRLAKTGCVEFIGETYYHSLAALYDLDEFDAQIAKHRNLMRELFGQRPRVFRNTELIYDDRIGRHLAAKGYDAVIAEGADDILDWRSPNFAYRVPGTNTSLLLKNYRLSDDIAFRFSNRSWAAYPLMANTFSRWVHDISGAGEVVNLFMDYETFGEHQWESTGIFEFLRHIPSEILKHPDWKFQTPSEVVASYPPVADLSFGRTTSWADLERDTTAWNGNRMQAKALNAIFALKHAVYSTGDPAIVDTWRKLQTSDHFYYMCTKWFADGDVHAYFSPFESPYDAFINYKNVLKDFSANLNEPAEFKPEAEAPERLWFDSVGAGHTV
jgi:alpha-amylase